MVNDERQAGQISAKGLREWAKGQRAENRHGSADIAEIAADTIEDLEERVGELEAEVEGGRIAFGHVVEAKQEATKRCNDLQRNLNDALGVIERKNGEIAELKARQALREEPGEEGA